MLLPDPFLSTVQLAACGVYGLDEEGGRAGVLARRHGG